VSGVKHTAGRRLKDCPLAIQRQRDYADRHELYETGQNSVRMRLKESLKKVLTGAESCVKVVG
jgi:hypothetical protein